jgi:copper chaperone NosL
VKPSTRILTTAAALMLAPMYAFPIWRINLIAPQYPEGIGMYIHIDSIGGVKEHDLENINQLNHYIGMRVIDPLSIPELRWMPWILGALLAFGLLAAVVSSRKVLVAWVASFAVAAGAGFADFWKWSYDYGHNLDWEHAIIKVPGMVYQPPLIGVKQILNFRASSWPDVGGVAAFLAMALAIAAVVVEFRGRRGRNVPVRSTSPAAASGRARPAPIAC